MINFHRAIDQIEGALRSAKPQAPIHSQPGDLSRFVTDDPRSLHPSVEPAALTLYAVASKRKRERPVARRFSYPSPIESPYPPNNTVHGVRWHGSGFVDARTAVVMLHAAFAPSFPAERLISRPLFGDPVHVYTLAAPYHMVRSPAPSRYSGQYLMSGDVPRLIDGMIQAAADVRALLAALKALGYRRLFLAGMSLGGNIAAQVASFCRVDGLLLIMPAVDLYSTLESAPIARGMRRAAEGAGFDQADVQRAMRCITPRLLGPPLCRADRVALFYGTWDRQVAPGTITALRDVWRIRDVTEYPRGHRSMGFSLKEVSRKMADRVLREVKAYYRSK